jgi:hypothetical protein
LGQSEDASSRLNAGSLGDEIADCVAESGRGVSVEVIGTREPERRPQRSSENSAGLDHGRISSEVIVVEQHEVDAETELM